MQFVHVYIDFKFTLHILYISIRIQSIFFFKQYFLPNKLFFIRDQLVNCILSFLIKYFNRIPRLNEDQTFILCKILLVDISILICDINIGTVFQIDILYVFYSDLLVRYIIWHILTRKQGCIATTLCVNKMYYFLLFYIISARRLLEHYNRNPMRSMPYSCLHPDCLADFHYNPNMSMPCSYLHPVCFDDY